MITPTEARQRTAAAQERLKQIAEEQEAERLRVIKETDTRIRKNVALLLQEAETNIAVASSRGFNRTSVHGWYSHEERDGKLVENISERYEALPKLELLLKAQGWDTKLEVDQESGYPVWITIEW
jgi:hypothetical protein